jgi:hypothetical protein
VKNLLGIKEENLTLDKNFYSSLFADNEIDKLCLILKMNENNKLYFFQKGGLEHAFIRLTNFTKFVEIM